MMDKRVLFQSSGNKMIRLSPQVPRKFLPAADLLYGILRMADGDHTGIFLCMMTEQCDLGLRDVLSVGVYVFLTF